MKKSTYIYTVLCVIAIVISIVNCKDEDLLESGLQTDMKDFSLQEAKNFFQTQAHANLTLSRSLDNKRNKTVSPGDFVPNWDAAVSSTNNGLACYDIPITPTYHFKAIYVDERNGKPSAGKVNVYQKLVIVKDVKSNRMDQYILTLIPSKLYDSRNGAQTCNNFINCADKGGFTGVALYSCVYSQVTARISTFKNGVKTRGVFLLNASGKTNLSDKYEQARALASTVYIQKKKMVLTRGEDDYNYDYDYGNEDDYTYIGETLEEVIITPESNNNETSGGNDEWEIIAPPDSGTIDPEPTEPESTSTEDDTVTENNNGDQNSDEKSIPLSTAEKKAVNSLLIQLEKLKNIDRTKYTIEKQNYCRSTARTSKDGVLQLCQLFFCSDNLTEIDRIATIWHEMYHIDHKHYGKLEMTILEKTIVLNPPPYIEKILNERLDIMYGKYIMTPETREADFKQELIIDRYGTIEYYKNELETHKAERENFPEVSHYYENERTWLEWTYEQLLIIATEQSSNK